MDRHGVSSPPSLPLPNPSPRPVMVQLLRSFSSASDSQALPMNCLPKMVYIISGTCSRSRLRSITNSTARTYGSGVLMRCVSRRRPSGTNLTCAQPNRCNICVSDERHATFLRRVIGHRRDITFSSNHPNARLPTPKLLALHAACTRIVHMSGVVEAIGELERDVEVTRVLAFDGSSARLLDHLMTPFATIPGVV